MNDNDIDYRPRCGRASYLWESTGCDFCAATVREFELVGLPSVAQGWQGSPYVSGDATCIKALFALKAREMRATLKRIVTREEVVEALRRPEAAPLTQSVMSMLSLSQISVGRKLADYYRGLMNTK